MGLGLGLVTLGGTAASLGATVLTGAARLMPGVVRVRVRVRVGVRVRLRLRVRPWADA